MSYGLTQKQHELLGYLENYIQRHGYSPSYQEMADFLGVASRSGVHRLVHGLIERGHIAMLPSSARSITLTMPEAAWGMRL